ncbi:MAG: hypothetical protein AB7S41_08145 [Parvibaculaceae bacterium]
MVKLLLSGLWICIVTLASSYAVVAWKADAVPDPKKEEFFGGLDYVKTGVISVPVIDEGEVQGYIVAQFVFTADGQTLRSLSVAPDSFIIDEAYRAIYAGEKVNFRRIEKYDLDALTKDIAVKVNERFKTDLVKDVLVEQFNYVSKEEIREKGLQNAQRH